MKHICVLAALLCGLIMKGEECMADSMAIADRAPVNAEQAHLDKVKNSRKVAWFGGDESKAVSQDSIQNLIARFYIDQYHHFQDPEAPYFLMMSRDATLAMGIGGAVRMRGWYDFGGAMPYNGFIPYSIPVPADDARRRRLAATPAGTALFFRIIGTNKALGNFSAFIQGNFDGGDGTGFKIKKSYVTINDWTIGYASSSFMDLAADPPVIDAQGPCGQVNNTSVLVAWRHDIRQRWTLGASVEFPKSAVAADGVSTKTLADWFPDIVAYGQWNFGRAGGHLRLSGLLRVMPYRDLTAARNRSAAGWSAQLSSVAPLSYGVTLFASALAGKGAESYVNDMMLSPLDLLPDPGRDGRMYAPWFWGATAGVRYNFTDAVFGSVSVSESRLMARHGIAGDQYKYGLYGVANIFWNMSARLQVGAEYLIGRRCNYNGESASANRVNLLFQFSF